jgi:hypothetical protein
MSDSHINCFCPVVFFSPTRLYGNVYAATSACIDNPI